MNTPFSFSRCPQCMEPMDEKHGSCSHCSFFQGFVTEETFDNGDILHLPPSLNMPFYGGAYIRHIDFGNVYIGYSTHLKRKVLLKEYHPFPLLVRNHDAKGRQFIPHPGCEDQFAAAAEAVMEEARALSQITIPGAEQVYGAFRANGTVYQVTEFIPGPSLKDISMPELWKIAPGMFPRNFMEKKIPELSLYRHIRPVLLLLQRMHFNGIYHGNIDPSCILLDMDHPRLVLANLGTKEAKRKHSSNSTAWEEYNKFLPSPYMMLTPAQEDVFAICNTLYHIITGALPPWNEHAPRTQPDIAPMPRVIESILIKGSSPQKIKGISGMKELIHLLDTAFIKLAALQE